MQKLKIDLENCYGIKKLNVEFNFTKCHVAAVYAPNGAMKSSLANTFQALAEGKQPIDRFFPNRATTCSVVDENGAAIKADEILVVRPYDESFSHSAKTSALLVNATLREEYEKLHADLEVTKAEFLKALKTTSGSKRDLEAEISSAFTPTNDQFYVALARVKDEVAGLASTPFATVEYDKLFDEKGLAVLEQKDSKDIIAEYIKKYNELIDSSSYFKRGTFNYFNAGQIAKSLADHGFFKADHTITLKGGGDVQIKTEQELKEIIQKERDAITNDPALRKKFEQLATLLEKNAEARKFEAYLSEHEDLLPHLANVPALKDLVWKSYFKANEEVYRRLLDQRQSTEKRRLEIEASAAAERSQWQEVIDIFNERFSVPFKLAPKNLVAVALAKEPILALDFKFEDAGDSVSVKREDLIAGLSTGERKAFYLLNVLFEIEVRRRHGASTLIIVDDVADSFDYKNKYAIVQYLGDIAEDGLFRQIILTHNFDFFRTVNSRGIASYSCCFMASKSSTGVTLYPAQGINNIFVNDWKPNFFTDEKKRVASIPFMRNLVEFTSGDADPNFAKLTALLHVKPGSDTITQGDLDAIYNQLFGGTAAHPDPAKTVFQSIDEAAAACIGAPEGANFENKIVLAIAVRLAAERYMIAKIADPAFTNAISSNQTARLVGRFKKQFPTKTAEIKVLERVALMTPENIHLNSFMYEPILDMSDEHLRRLYQDVVALP
jgi:energy-coupling factor transporter ATP-binding protein EcfA2